MCTLIGAHQTKSKCKHDLAIATIATKLTHDQLIHRPASVVKPLFYSDQNDEKSKMNQSSENKIYRELEIYW